MPLITMILILLCLSVDSVSTSCFQSFTTFHDAESRFVTFSHCPFSRQSKECLER